MLLLRWEEYTRLAVALMGGVVGGGVVGALLSLGGGMAFTPLVGGGAVVGGIGMPILAVSRLMEDVRFTLRYAAMYLMLVLGGCLMLVAQWLFFTESTIALNSTLRYLMVNGTWWFLGLRALSTPLVAFHLASRSRRFVPLPA